MIETLKKHLTVIFSGVILNKKVRMVKYNVRI